MATESDPCGSATNGALMGAEHLFDGDIAAKVAHQGLFMPSSACGQRMAAETGDLRAGTTY
jgi:hypothetical protein